MAQENPELAKSHGLTDYQAIKVGVKQVYEFGKGNRPLALESATDFDIFKIGINAEVKRQAAMKPMSEVERKELEETGRTIKRDFMIMAGVVTGITAGVALAPVLVRAGQWLIGVASTPEGQEVIKNTVECVEALVDGTPLPTTPKGKACFAIEKIYEKIIDETTQ